LTLQLLVSGIIGRDHARGGSWSARKQARAVIGDWKYVWPRRPWKAISKIHVSFW